MADFRINAYPVLQQFGFPATVYLTSYYCLYNRPIFRFALGHMMWKRREEIITVTGVPWLPERIDLRTSDRRALLVRHIDDYAKRQDLSGKQKDGLAAEFASIIGFGYENFTRERLFQLMNPEEITEIARGGVDIPLHTHRHRTPLDRDHFVGEIAENRRIIEEVTGADRRGPPTRCA